MGLESFFSTVALLFGRNHPHWSGLLRQRSHLFVGRLFRGIQGMLSLENLIVSFESGACDTNHPDAQSRCKTAGRNPGSLRNRANARTRARALKFLYLI